MIPVHPLLILLALCLVVLFIDRQINLFCDRRDARRNKVTMLCKDPRQAKVMLNLYCASEAESNERDWLNNPAMQRLRRQAKDHLR